MKNIPGEAGVRWLKKQLAGIARFVSEKIVSGNIDLPYIVKVHMLKEILGKEVIRQEEIRKKQYRVVTGLAWTPVGGDILFIEMHVYAGNRESLPLPANSAM